MSKRKVEPLLELVEKSEFTGDFNIYYLGHSPR